jgi:hypothetical protein
MSSVNGTSAKPITIKATGSNANFTVTTDRSDNRDTIFVTFCSYIVLDGLNAASANRSGVRIDSSPNITLQNGKYSLSALWGIFTDFSDNLLLQYNECSGTVGQHGIYVSNSCTGAVVRGNRCHDNNDCGIQFNGDASSGYGLILNALCEDNILYGNGKGGGAAINTDGLQNSTIRNNLLYNNYAQGIVMYNGDSAAGPSNNQIYYNTIDMSATANGWALLIFNTAGPITVRDNILINRSAPNNGGIIYGAAADVANTDSDYNIQDLVSPDGGATNYTLAQWQSQGHEKHSLSATPTALFVNASAGNYHLTTGAPAIAAGVAIASIASDLEGNARPTSGKSDIGAYETKSSSPPPPPPPSQYGYLGYVYSYYAYTYAYSGYAATGNSEGYLGYLYGYYGHYYATQAYYYDSGTQQTQNYYAAYIYTWYCWYHSNNGYTATHNISLFDAQYYADYAFNDLYQAYLGH